MPYKYTQWSLSPAFDVQLSKALSLLLQEKQNWAPKPDRHESHLFSDTPELTNETLLTAACICI